MCLSLKEFYLFLKQAQLEEMVERVNAFTIVVHATSGDVLWFLTDIKACTGGMGV